MMDLAAGMYMNIFSNPKTAPSIKLKAVEAFCRLLGLNAQSDVSSGPEGINMDAVVALVESGKRTPIIDTQYINGIVEQAKIEQGKVIDVLVEPGGNGSGNNGNGAEPSDGNGCHEAT